MFIKKFLTGVMVATMLFAGFFVAQTVFEPTMTYATTSSTGATFDGITISMSGGSAVIGGTNITADQNSAWNLILEKFQVVVMGISGIGTICMILFFIMNFIKLGASSTNPSDVAKIKTALLYSGLAAAGLGSVTFIVGLFYGILGTPSTTTTP